ncbi:MAG: hypothetical protein J0J14_05310 [Hyphomicrobium sp.]|nr:hypothetical protein [Hyphomicrobium sp.]MBN9264752.1 hypothetical protein [Hyphomicrobium sp.]
MQSDKPKLTEFHSQRVQLNSGRGRSDMTVSTVLQHSKVALAVIAVEAAASGRTRRSNSAMPLEVARERLLEVLRRVEAGRYKPTMHDALAALDLAQRKGSALGFTSIEHRLLMNVAAATLRTCSAQY